MNYLSRLGRNPEILPDQFIANHQAAVGELGDEAAFSRKGGRHLELAGVDDERERLQGFSRKMRGLGLELVAFTTFFPGVLHNENNNDTSVKLTPNLR